MKLPDNLRFGAAQPLSVAVGALVLSLSFSAGAQQGLPAAQPLAEEPAAQQQQSPQANRQAPQQSQQQQGQQQGQQANQQQSGQQSAQQQSNPQTRGVQPRAKDGTQSMYQTRVSDLRDTVVVDESGASIGYVEDIVVKQDNSEAGLVVATGGEQEFKYVSLAEVSLQGEQFLLQGQVSPAPITEQELRARNFNEVPDTDRPLGDYIQEGNVQQKNVQQSNSQPSNQQSQ